MTPLIVQSARLEIMEQSQILCPGSLLSPDHQLLTL